MITYIDNGSLTEQGAKFPVIPKDQKNGDYQRVLAEVAAGTAEIVPYLPTPDELGVVAKAKAEADTAVREQQRLTRALDQLTQKGLIT